MRTCLKIIPIAIFFVLFLTAPAHAGWYTQNSGTNTTLFSVSCIRETQQCWAVGDSGTILKTQNAGSVWTIQSQGVFPTLFDIQFIDENTGWAVGSHTIIKTTDGGVTWNVQWQDSTKDLKAVHFNSIYGWAVGSGGTILNTVNGGTTWVPLTSGTTNDLADVVSVENVVEYVVGSGGLILKSNDGGATWIAQNSGTTNTLINVDFVTRTNGWVAGNGGIILKTTDGGATWIPVESGTSSTIYGMDLVSSTTATVVGGSGMIRRTVNESSSWFDMPSGIVLTLRHIYAGRFSFSDYGGLAVGDNGIILREGNLVPDLHINPIARIPDTPTNGSPFTLRVGVQNLGTGTAGASTLNARFDLGNNGQHIGSDPYGTFDETLPARSIGPISAGGSSATVEWNWSAWPSGGPHRIVLCADSTGAVAESDENNNCSVTVIISNPAVVVTLLPDLVVESVGFEPGLNTPNLVIVNQGTAESSSPTAPLVKLEWLTANNTVVGDAVSQGIVALTPGQKAPMAFDTAHPPAGAMRLRMTVDVNNVISELNENNNVWIGDILLSDLVIQSVTFSTESRVPTVVVRNQGSAPALSRFPPATPRILYQWLNVTGGVIGTGVELAIPAGLAANSTYTLPGGTSVPPDGAVRLRVSVDPINLMPELVGELNEANNVWEGPVPERGQTLPPTPASNNSMLQIERRFVGQYNNIKFNLIVSDPEGIKIFKVNTARGSVIFLGEPPCLTRVESGTVDLEVSDFPLTVTMTDCNTPGQVSTFQVSMPALPSGAQESREAVVEGERPPQVPTSSPPIPRQIELSPEQKAELNRQAEEERRMQIEKIKESSAVMLLGLSKVAEEKQVIRDTIKEQFAGQKIEMITKIGLTTTLSVDKKQVVEEAMKAFIAYGAPTKVEVLDKPIEKLGAGERAGVVNSFKEAFGKLPETDKDWEDVMKIAIGRFPSQKNENREQEAEEIFKRIYLRVPLRTQPNDNACVTVIAYGLRPNKRNFNSEKVAIQTFKKIFKKGPVTASDWDTMRCVAYSGARR